MKLKFIKYASFINDSNEQWEELDVNEVRINDGGISITFTNVPTVSLQTDTRYLLDFNSTIEQGMSIDLTIVEVSNYFAKGKFKNNNDEHTTDY